MNTPCRQSFHVIQAINILLSHPTTKNCNAYIIKITTAIRSIIALCYLEFL